MMRVETTFDGVYEFYWDSRNQLRGWNSYYESDQRSGQSGHMLVEGIQPTGGGRSMEVEWYDRNDDPDWRSIEWTDIDGITRVFINGEEVYNSDRI